MPQVDYLPVAISGGANVDSQADFANSSYQLNGFVNGMADPAEANKIWRQSSMMAAALANYISNALNVDVLDDGNLSLLITNLGNALATAASGGTLTQPTQPYGDNSTKVANTAFVQAAVGPVATAAAAAQTSANAAGAAATAAQASANTALAEIAALNFGATLAANGSQTLPSGLIIKWATGAVDHGSASDPAQTVTFAAAFPNNNFGSFVSTNLISGDNGDIQMYSVTSSNNAGVSVKRMRRGDEGDDYVTSPTVFSFGN